MFKYLENTVVYKKNTGSFYYILSVNKRGDYMYDFVAVNVESFSNLIFFAIQGSLIKNSFRAVKNQHLYLKTMFDTLFDRYRSGMMSTFIVQLKSIQ